MSGQAFVVFGQLLGLAFAAGLNLYSTVALLGLAAQMGWVGALPPELRGLQHPIVIYSAAALYFIEFVIDKIPRYDTVWDTLHTVIRPAAAATLAVAAVGDVPLSLRMATGVLAGAVALLAHGTKAGLRVTIMGGRGKAAHAAVSVAEDVLAVGLAGAALRFPAAALGLTGAAIAATLPTIPRLSRAFLMGVRGALARARGLFFGGHWRAPREMPASLQALLAPEVFGFGTPGTARVAVRGLPGVGAYRNGWIVMAGERPMLLYRARFRPHALELPPGEIDLRRGFWADVASIRTDRVRYFLYFLKDGPAPELALDQLGQGAPAAT
jgi:hypothetical protein